MIDSSDRREEDEAQHILFTDNGMREQLFSELSLLVATFGDSSPADTPKGALKLRLVMHIMEVASRYPTLGSLLAESPRKVDELVTETLMQWLNQEAVLAITGKKVNSSHEPSIENDTTLNSINGQSQNNVSSLCPTSVWTSHWPLRFWEALHTGHVKLEVRIAIDVVPDFFQLGRRRLQQRRPRDELIGSGKWVQIVGNVVSVFFRHRESTDPEPMVELQPLIANCVGSVGESPVWLDLSLLPQPEMMAAAVVGERVHAVGLLEIASRSTGTPLYSKRGALSSDERIFLQARIVHTPVFVSQWSNYLFATAAAAAVEPFSYLMDENISEAREDEEAHALRQARCCWESVAGAAVFAMVKSVGGLTKAAGATRTEAALEMLRVSALPPSLWAAVGIVLVSSKSRSSGIATTVIGLPDLLAVLQAFLLELGAQTNLVVPVVRGLEKALLPKHARVTVTQVPIPIETVAEPHVELVRGGILNTAHQRVVFVPSLHTIASSALNAIQGALEQTEQVVVREGGQPVTCRTASALLGITQEAALKEQRNIFEFVGRSDFVLHIPSASLEPPQEQAVKIAETLQAAADPGNPAVDDFFKRCNSQWDSWSNWALSSAVESSSMPRITNPCAALLHAYFLSTKTLCGDTVDVSLMNVLVKLTSAHALLRCNNYVHKKEQTFGSIRTMACVCASADLLCAHCTALIDAVVAIALCDASLKFMTGISLVGDTSVFSLALSDDHFNVLHYAKDLHNHLESCIPPSSL
uniref:Uncharacterized protein n=1 Tax=Trypanosoma congolense (strain IL3000) TaxID=1068625 RepID=G0UXN0_TRYCI|nr:conserved hypothetical protein [Trypanosoma congolense IL3000]